MRQRLAAAEAVTVLQEAQSVPCGPADATDQGKESRGVQTDPAVGKRSSIQRPLHHLSPAINRGT